VKQEPTVSAVLTAYPESPSFREARTSTSPNGIKDDDEINDNEVVKEQLYIFIDNLEHTA